MTLSRIDDIAARLEAPVPYPESLLLEQPRADLAALLEFTQAVEALHRPHPNSISALHPRPLCSCGAVYPCPTAEALNLRENR